MRAHGYRTALTFALTGALLAACGATSSGGANQSSAPPATELTQSVHALTAGHSLTLTFNLGLTLADIARISAVEHDTPPPAVQQAMTQDHVTIAMEAAPGGTLRNFHPTATSRAGGLAITFGDAHTDYFAFEEINGSLYGRIDLRYFLSLGGNRAGFAKIQHQVTSMPPFVQAAVSGRWVSVSASTLKALNGFAQGLAATRQEEIPKTPAPAKILALTHRLLSTLLADLTVSRVSSGTVDHLAVSFALRRLLTDEYAIARPFLSSIVPIGGGLPPLKPADIPSVVPRFDAYVTGGTLSKVVFDAGQFDQKHHISVPIILTIARHGPAITAPSNSVPVDLSSIGHLIGAAGGSA
jgi:hypothetical protein